MAAKVIGTKLGKAVGWTAATAWKGTCMAAGALGEAGEGFLEGTEAGWEGRCSELDAKIAAHKAKLAARKAELLAAKTQPATPSVIVTA